MPSIDDSKPDSFTARSYQTELVDKAKSENIIIPLGTGTGKTFIAVMLIKEMAASIRQPISNGGKRTFFLCVTVPLVSQQAKHIRDFTDLTVGEFHGKMNVDLWTKSKWNEQLAENNVLVMTAQIFLNLLNHGYWTLALTNLLVFDECHHAKKSDPYREIMRHYIEIPEETRPRVLGLTASVISGNILPLQLESKIAELEQILCAKVEIPSDIVMVNRYGAKPKESIIGACDFDDTEGYHLCQPALKLLDKALEFTKKANFNKELDLEPEKVPKEIFWRTKTVLTQLGPWAGWRVALQQYKMLEKLSIYAMTPLQETFILLTRTYLRVIIKILHKRMVAIKSVAELTAGMPPKFCRLVEILIESNPTRTSAGARNSNEAGDDSFAGIIFVKERYIAFILAIIVKQIQQWDPERLGYISSDFVIGYTGSRVQTDEQLSLQRRQDEALRNFRHKDLNLLIATSVLEEGVDVRHCNCVIRFNHSRSERSERSELREAKLA